MILWVWAIDWSWQSFWRGVNLNWCGRFVHGDRVSSSSQTLAWLSEKWNCRRSNLIGHRSLPLSCMSVASRRHWCRHGFQIRWQNWSALVLMVGLLGQQTADVGQSARCGVRPNCWSGADLHCQLAQAPGQAFGDVMTSCSARLPHAFGMWLSLVFEKSYHRCRTVAPRSIVHLVSKVLCLKHVRWARKTAGHERCALQCSFVGRRLSRCRMRRIARSREEHPWRQLLGMLIWLTVSVKLTTTITSSRRSATRTWCGGSHQTARRVSSTRMASLLCLPSGSHWHAWADANGIFNKRTWVCSEHIRRDSHQRSFQRRSPDDVERVATIVIRRSWFRRTTCPALAHLTDALARGHRQPYVGAAILNTLTSHVRRVRIFQSAFLCVAFSLTAPMGADKRPHHCRPGLWFAAESSTTEVVRHLSVSDSVSPRWIAEFAFLPVVPRAAHSPILCWSIWRQMFFSPFQSHS